MLLILAKPASSIEIKEADIPMFALMLSAPSELEPELKHCLVSLRPVAVSVSREKDYVLLTFDHDTTVISMSYEDALNLLARVKVAAELRLPETVGVK